MIRIVESKPRKLSGLTSLFISFPFNKDLINIIKSHDNYSYDKNDFTWEVPVTSLAYLLDEFTYIDDITLVLNNAESSGIHYVPILKDDYKVPAFKHQLEGIEWFLNHDCGLLLDQPGLGKTAQIIHLAEELRQQKGIRHCLIICGINALKSNWKKEILFHSDLSYRVIGEKIARTGNISYASIADRAKEIYNPLEPFFYITNIESLRNDDFLQALRTSRNKIDMIVVDEIHKCSGPQSLQGKNLLKLKNYPYKIGLTGTLLTNTPLSAYLALKFIGVEQATLTNFKNQYCVFGGFGGYQIMGYKNIPLLKNEIEACSIRRTKDLLNLPPKNIIDEVLEMNPSHARFYENVRDGVKEECDKVDLNASNVLSLMTRLREATSCPAILTTESIMSTKIERCLDLIEEITSQGDKVVVMSLFKEPITELNGLLAKYKPLMGTGDLWDDEVSNNIDLFQNDDEHMVFLGTHAKCGTGITLNRARYLIMLDLPWTDANYQQITDRIHRVTNTEPVFVYNLICQGTVDEFVAGIVKTKKALSDFMIDDKVDQGTLDVLRNYIQDL